MNNKDYFIQLRETQITEHDKERYFRTIDEWQTYDQGRKTPRNRIQDRGLQNDSHEVSQDLR